MKAYKIKDNRIIAIRILTGELQDGEIEGDFIRPDYVNGELIETWTQADEDAEVIRLEKLTVRELLDKFEDDGNEFYYEVRDLVKYHLSKATITETQYKLIRVTLEPALRPLKLGDWDIAQDNVNAITRPTGILSELYDKVKNGIDNYLTD